METIDTWKGKQRSESLFSLRAGENPLLQLLKVGKANRINTVDQAKRIAVFRAVLGDYMGWGWAHALCDYVEDYQLTCGEPHNSREMFLSGLQFTEWAGHDRSKTSFTLSGATDGSKGK